MTDGAMMYNYVYDVKVSILVLIGDLETVKIQLGPPGEIYDGIVWRLIKLWDEQKEQNRVSGDQSYGGHYSLEA